MDKNVFNLEESSGVFSTTGVDDMVSGFFSGEEKEGGREGRIWGCAKAFGGGKVSK